MIIWGQTLTDDVPHIPELAVVFVTIILKSYIFDNHSLTHSSRQDLMDRLIIINSDAKIHSLFNYEQSHTFGLR